MTRPRLSHRSSTALPLLVLAAVAVVAATCATVAVGQQTVTLTTENGAPIDNARSAQTVGNRGPVLLQDFQLIERLQIHNRERIPERNVHARGALAKGYFQVTDDISNLTFAEVFNGVGKQTPVALRFSTVIHSLHSPEFLRDPRGFALKFYSQEGNYDIVGLNFPVFFIRDGIRFPEMIRSLKPNPLTGVQEWWRVWDFFSNYPESTHMFTWLLDDVGIPASYCQLDGWGVHTYKFISKAGKELLVRYYFESAQGVVSLNDDDAVKEHFSFATIDLTNRMNAGSCKWTLYIQVLDPSDTRKIESLSYDYLDTTKQWQVSDFPLQRVGTLVLNENPRNQFLENEQSAFSPARMVPGIAPSDEKMLQARLFSYGDTQRYRLGTNNQMLPINRPKCPFFDNHVDGLMNFNEPTADSAGEINYFPSNIRTNVKEAAPYYHETEVVTGQKVRANINLTNDFAQPGARYRSFDSDRQNRLAQRIASALSDPRLPPAIQSTWLGYFGSADAGLRSSIEHYLSALQMSPEMVAEGVSAGTLHPKLKDIHAFRAAFHRAAGSQ
ncbi:catalase isozyme 2 [Capsaspora owczarzaki ATCC 30864]|uniref:catalase isozyme 2 n=1 Tax=Capsaspora owczarzaki (strain ATCC 30864) TaxID=595528 RepID=UPI0003525C70|nr:catalase isozyme 2 [Capsaspora owczarzaki ATCC 30864]|eukprot:XP_004366029.2 catalase isozyme 2 [Capsaspora owczarzaki ATCC 30864]